MSNEAVLYQEQGGVVRLTINRPADRNPLSSEVIQLLHAGLRRAQADASVRAIVLTGAGDRTFCAGGDLKPGAKSFVFDYTDPSTHYARLLNAAAECTMPLIARINGHCMAGGMGLLGMCDMAIASSNAIFGLPEVKIGLFPMQVDALLQRLIPRRKLIELSLTGEPIDAVEAKEIGLINYHVPPAELDAKVDWLLGRLLDKSPTAIRRGKHAMEAISDMTLPQAIAYMATQLGTLALTEDATEGLAAFNEKRAPKWPGR
ncbi:MAG: enoyl-CoA hydratase/isomerase family protein [Burkholderiaceae bacterium]